MIAIVRQTARQDQLQHFVEWVERRGFRANVSKGDDKTIVGIVGDTSRIDPFLLESMDIVERVQRVSEPYKLANRKFHPADSVIDCGRGVAIGGWRPCVIGGPSMVEDEGFDENADAVHEAGANILRAGARRQRTSPYANEGLGERGYRMLAEAGERLDMPTLTQVGDPREVEAILGAGVSMLEVGSRNVQSIPLLRELGQTGVPVVLRRGRGMTIDELLMAAEYVMSTGNDRVILCECGTCSFDARMRASLDVGGLAALMGLTHLPIIVDPSRAATSARLVPQMACAAIAAGAAGVELDAHRDPSAAWATGAATLRPEQFAAVVERVARVHAAVAGARS